MGLSGSGAVRCDLWQCDIALGIARHKQQISLKHLAENDFAITEQKMKPTRM